MTTGLAHIGALIGETGDGKASSLGGGDLSTLYRLRFGSGREVVVKLGDRVTVEADMLGAIAGTGVRAPHVLALEPGLLVMEYIAPRRAGGLDWASLGGAMRRLHDAPQPSRFGWDRDYAFGPVPVPNRRTEDWRIFWRESRLEPCLDALPRAIATRVSRLSHALDSYLQPAPRPALLHGDLWTGNVITTEGPHGEAQAVLIDPACYIGDASADFAILTLFATPPRIFWEAYGSLPEGFARALDVYRLWPALVHYRLFGDGYLGMVETILKSLDL